MRRVALALALLAAVPGPARARPARTVAGIALPSRRADRARLAERASRLAAQLARRIGAAPAAVPRDPHVSQLVERGRELFLAGKVDEAAATLDVALEAAARRPDAVGDPASLIAGQMTRVQIALARGESAAAGALLIRLIRWDGDFAPAPDEATPAVKQAVDAATASEAAAGPLTGDDTGEACRAVDDLVVVRAARGGAVEIARLDHCRVTASVVAGAELADGAVLDRLAPRPPAPPPPPAREERSLVSRPWFWVAVGAVAAASIGGGLWLAGQGDEQGGFDVAVRF